ncbi:uncharacterized protein PAC_06485 [Phialocephala subalpina]|uniref:Uncharacterized protein n=1 Tax=Phialocephala subalpina TaxID=576137 RepID=A0A1L7WUZ5_9HELO|nr:uncharacterized protein PAC_06485 [Phialocephala subalpina]
MQQSIIPPPPITIVVAQSAPENLLSWYVVAAADVEVEIAADVFVAVGVPILDMEDGEEGEDKAVTVTVTKSEIAFESVADAELADSVDIPRCSEDAALGKESTIGTLDILG